MAAKKRSNMKPEDRRNQILDCAESLFFSKGFEDVTISDIILEAGISKGGFYHHFASKEDLLFATFERRVVGIVEPMTAIANDKTKSAVDRAQSIYDLQGMVIKSGGVDRQAKTRVHLFKDTNSQIYARYRRTIERESVPILTKIVQDGKDGGEFAVEDATATATFLVTISGIVGQTLTDAINARGTGDLAKAKTDLTALIDVQFKAVNLVLGLPVGTLTFGWPGFVDTMMAYNPSD